MQTITFIKTAYIVEPGIGAPDGAVDISAMSSKDQVELYNLVSSNLGGGRVTKFKDKATGTRRTIAALTSWRELPEEADEVAPTRERKKRGIRFVFPFNGQEAMRSIRDTDTLRGQCVTLLREGATFDKVEALVVVFDKKKGRTPTFVTRRAYELVRIMHYYVGYGVDHDMGTGVIKLHTRPVGQKTA